MLITASHITKYNNLKCIVDDVSFTINEQDKIALIGVNGTGKSTLLKMISDRENYQGDILKKKDIQISYLSQNPHFQDDYSVLKQVYEYVGHDIPDYEVKAILNKFGITNYEQRIKELSGGQQKRVALAITLLKPCDLLLLDEPTNHLDITMLEWLENYLNKYRGTIVIISHDRYFLDRVTNKTILLDNSENRLFHGNYSYTLKEQERLLLQEFEQYKTQQKKIEAIKASIKRYRDWGNQGDNEKFFKKAKELEKRLEKIEILDKPQLEKKKLPLNFLGERSSKEVLKVIDFGISFNNLSLFSKVNFTLYYQEKTVLLGNNGSGKTSFIKALLGNLNNYQGELKMAETVLIGYIPQEINFINNNDSILQTFCHEYPCLEGEARGILAKYSFYQDQVFKRVGNLSGGEKVLLKMAILMQHKVNLLILDEPTNHIDIETREILEDALSNYSGTLLFVSHDRYFIDKLAQRKLVIENNTINSVYCDYK